MTQFGITLLSAAGLTLLNGANLRSQSTADTVETHLAAAWAAAGEHLGLFTDLCAPSYLQNGFVRQVISPPPAPPAAARRRALPDRSLWYAEPVKVFDNLYFLGQSPTARVPGPNAWAVTTSGGIILIDTLWDYSVRDEIVGGLKKLGLDPAQIKYAVVSHGHADHSEGAAYLQEQFGTRVILSAADWDLLEGSTRPQLKPKRDMVATDGQELTLGDTTLTLYITPGHTPGTISMLVPVKDGDSSHVAASWGGTAFNLSTTPFDSYAESARRFRQALPRHRREGRG